MSPKNFLQYSIFILSYQEIEDFVFATAGSNGFVNMLSNTAHSIQKFQGKKKLLVYDLGLSEPNIKKVGVS